MANLLSFDKEIHLGNPIPIEIQNIMITPPTDQRQYF